MGHWETVTFIAGLRQTGIVAPMLIKGAKWRSIPGLRRAMSGANAQAWGHCDDIVTALTNVGGPQTINISGTDYIFAFTGFLVGGSTFTSFPSPEGGSSPAILRVVH